MSLRIYIRNWIIGILKLFHADYLLEYYSIKRNEKGIIGPLKRFYSGFIKPGTRVIDVGANVGNYSRVFLDLGADVIGVEPQVFCGKILQKRFKGNERFKLVAKASGASIQISEIFKSKSHTIASMNTEWINNVEKSRRFDAEKWNDKEMVEVTTLDNIIHENNFIPDYIKIDVEGFESEVLKGLSSPVAFISFELTLPEMKEAAIACMSLVNELGNYKFAIPETGKLIEVDSWKSYKEICDQIDLLVRSDKPVSNDIICKLVKE